MVQKSKHLQGALYQNERYRRRVAKGTFFPPLRRISIQIARQPVPLSLVSLDLTFHSPHLA